MTTKSLGVLDTPYLERSGSTPLEAPNVFPSSISPSSKAGWRRMRLETTSSFIEESDVEWKDLIEEAMNRGEYEKSLNLLDRMEPSLFDCIMPPEMFEVERDSGKAFCLAMLGRLEEALFFQNRAIETISSVVEKFKERWAEALAQFEELPEVPEFDRRRSEELIQTMTEWIEKDVAEGKSSLLVQRGLIQLLSNQKELAIADFKQAAPLQNGDLDPIFLFKVLEKKLGISLISPDSSLEYSPEELLIFEGEYEKALEMLTEDDFYSHYERAVCFALLGRYDEALVSYEKMNLENPESWPPISAICHYLKGDVEQAREGIERWSSEQSNFVLLMFFF